MVSASANLPRILQEKCQQPLLDPQKLSTREHYPEGVLRLPFVWALPAWAIFWTLRTGKCCPKAPFSCSIRATLSSTLKMGLSGPRKSSFSDAWLKQCYTLEVSRLSEWNRPGTFQRQYRCWVDTSTAPASKWVATDRAHCGVQGPPLPFCCWRLLRW